MKAISLKYITILFVISIVLCTGALAFWVFHVRPGACATNGGALVNLGSESKKVVHLAEAVFWPVLDFKNVQKFLVEPDPDEKVKVVKLVSQIIEPNYLPENLPEKVRFLKDWREEGRESFVLQYQKAGYVIRVKNQVTNIEAGRVWTSHWITVVIQAKDQSVCLNKSDPNTIFNFTDQFLCDKINSKAQNYSGIINMDKPAFKQMDAGYFLAYSVGASRPDIDGVCIWTDGRTVLINLKERRKILFRPTK
jgi:hypothetical protein